MVIQHRSILCDSKLALVSRGRAEVSRDGLCLYRYSVTITESSRDSPGRKSQGSITDLTSHARRGDCPSFTVYPVFRFPHSFSLSSSYITPPFPAPRISSLEEVNGVKLTVGSSVSWAGAPARALEGWQLHQDESPLLAHNGFIWFLRSPSPKALWGDVLCHLLVSHRGEQMWCVKPVFLLFSLLMN